MVNEYRDDGDGLYWCGNPEDELPYCKDDRKNQIKQVFEYVANSSGYITTAEGWLINARRIDLDNLRNLLEYAESIGLTELDVRTYDNQMVNMTTSRLRQLCSELVKHRLQLYQKKWAKLSEIESAITVEQVRNVIWI